MSRIPATLTRMEAEQCIADCGDDVNALLDLQEHWIGHREHNAFPRSDEIGDLLREYVDEVTSGDDARSNGPKDTDETGLTAP